MHDEEMVVALAGILAVFGLPFAGFVCWLVLHFCETAFRTWQEVGLKKAMVARGYTAQEIVQVVAAGKGSRPEKVTDIPPAKPIRQPAYG